jgi:RNA polymerase sigma-70 factor (ECF subfamily)
LSERESPSLMSTAISSPAKLRSFDRLYTAYARFVLRDVMSCGVPRSAVDDVVQDVFVVVHRRMAAFESRSAMRTWLSMIVNRVTRDHLRQLGHASVTEPLEINDGSTVEGPAEAFDHKAGATLLDDLLRRMTDVQREVFIMHEIEHMTVGEIASALPANKNTIYARLRAARRIFESGIRPYRGVEGET